MKKSRLPLVINNQDVHAPGGSTVADAIKAVNGEVHPGGGAVPDRPLCGIGRCNECIVTVDGVPGVKGCLTRVRAGMHISTEGQAK